MNANHQQYLQILESKTYDLLFVRRSGSDCFLIIRHLGSDRVFVNRLGKTPSYHHVWQIRQWLHKRFEIDPESVGVVEAPAPPMTSG